MARSTPDAVFEPFHSDAPQARRCDVPGCPEAGTYRAPKARSQLNDYYWFCLDHVRIYNRSWDYFHDLSEEEIERIRRRDTVWERPTWPFGGNYFRAEEKLRNAYHHAAGEKDEADRPNPLQSQEEKAFAVFDLEPSASFTEVKTRYKKLVKKHHPDANGGDRRAEERLKVINQAYQTLKQHFGPNKPR